MRLSDGHLVRIPHGAHFKSPENWTIFSAYDNENQSKTGVANIDESNEEKEPVSKKILIQK